MSRQEPVEPLEADAVPAVAFGESQLPMLIVDPAAARVRAANSAARDLPRDLAAYRVVAPDGSAGHSLADLVAGGRFDAAALTCTVGDGPRSFLVHCSPLAGHSAASPLALSFAEVTRLRTAEDALRGELEARDEFFSVAAHELKDPLAALQLALRLTLEMASDGLPGETLVEYLEIGRRQSERLGALMENLLDVSRIAHGRVHLDREAVDLTVLAREMAAQLRDAAAEAGAALTVEAPAPVVGYFDRVKAGQILVNLVTNALKYGEGSPVSVRVRGGEDDAFIEVEDAGRGIAPEDQERIFGRFERAADDRRRESLGLGLYIVKTYAEAHGGSADVRSEPGRGSTFTVRLPLRRLTDGSPDFDRRDPRK